MSKEEFPDLKRIDYNYTMTREQFAVLLYMQKNGIANNIKAMTLKDIYNGEMKNNLGGVKERTLYTYLSQLRKMEYVKNGYKKQKEQTYYITDKGLQKIGLEIQLAGGDVSWLDIKPRKGRKPKTKTKNSENSLSEKEVEDLIEKIEKECQEEKIELMEVEESEIKQKGEDKDVKE